MADRELALGFFSTYEMTVFVRRLSNNKFIVSDVIRRTAQNPSIRECFFYLGTQAATNNYKFRGVDSAAKLVSGLCAILEKLCY